MIVQGSNNPLVLTFDTSVENVPILSITLWNAAKWKSKLLKAWTRSDVIINGDTVVCPLTESETANLSAESLVLEVKGLDDEGNTIFWAEYQLDLLSRRDKVITLTQGG